MWYPVIIKSKSSAILTVILVIVYTSSITFIVAYISVFLLQTAHPTENNEINEESKPEIDSQKNNKPVKTCKTVKQDQPITSRKVSHSMVKLYNIYLAY